jgi:hypothetical protein
MAVQEQRSKFTLVYAATIPVEKHKVPEHPTEKRCDYIFVEPEQQALYVELKGSDIRSAVRQLHNTLKHIPHPRLSKLFFIIHHHCPYPATKLAEFRREFLKQTGYRLLIEKTPHEHPLHA